MKMKKLAALGMAALMTLSMTACGGDSKTTTAAAAGGATTAAEGTTAAAAGGGSQAAGEAKDPSGLAAAEFLTGTFTALPADGETVNLTLGHAGTESSTAHGLCLAFKEALEFYSDGKMTVTIYPNSQMGSDAEMISSCLAGDLDIVPQAGSVHLSFVPEAAIFDTPFLTAGYSAEKLTEVCIDSDFRDMYNELNEKAGLKLLQLKVVDSMNLTSNKAVHSLADLKGLKIRTAQSESRMAFWSALGANPTPLAFSELYMALQNGTVDAQDNIWENAVTSGAAEQQKYLIPTEHMMPSMEWSMNKEKFDSLPAEYQGLIMEISKAINAYDFSISVTNSEGYYNQLVNEYKLEVCEVSDEFREEMKAAAADSIQKVHDSVGNEALYETLEKCLRQ